MGFKILEHNVLSTRFSADVRQEESRQSNKEEDKSKDKGNRKLSSYTDVRWRDDAS